MLDKKIVKDKRIDLRITEQDKDAIRFYADGENLTISEFIIKCITDYIKRKDD